MRVSYVLVLAIALANCCPSRPAACPTTRVDAEATDEEVRSSGKSDACDRAGDRLAKLKCKDARPDFGAFCRNALKFHIPICPVKLSRITDCAQVAEVCR
jgi:hypothetical protein